ncbi:MAG: ferritin family protein [Deltaproteobacteria bacterium]|nr:ferritin family protein [Deltaproteobacteria bacterium]
MSFESLEEILQFAIDREREAATFYEDLARREAFSGARETFESFAREERKHESLLDAFLKGERTLGDYDFQWIPDLKRSNYTVAMTYEEGMDYADILRLATKREEASLALYNELAGKADRSGAFELFQMLSQEEAKHKLALETMLDDYLAAQGD